MMYIEGSSRIGWLSVRSRLLQVALANVELRKGATKLA